MVTSSFKPASGSSCDSLLSDSAFCQNPWKGSRNLPRGGMGVPKFQLVLRKKVRAAARVRERRNLVRRIGRDCLNCDFFDFNDSYDGWLTVTLLILMVRMMLFEL